MKDNTVKFAEQLGDIVTIYTKQDKFEVNIKEIESYIESHQLNANEEFWYNNSPLRDDDVRYDVFKTVYVSPDELLDDENNFQKICEQYYKHIFRLK